MCHINLGNRLLQLPLKDHLESLTKFTRVIILPWPPYTDAFKLSENDRLESGGGEVIEGQANNFHTLRFVHVVWDKNEGFTFLVNVDGN